MTSEQITTILSNLTTGSGVIFFLWMWVRALKSQISEMNKTIEVQQQTLKAMETRVLETEKIGNIYRQLFETLPVEVEKWKSAILKLKNERIEQLEKANQSKDERLKKTVEIELEKLGLQQQALEEIPHLRKELFEVTTTLEQRLSTVDQILVVDRRLDDLLENPEDLLGEVVRKVLDANPNRRYFLRAPDPDPDSGKQLPQSGHSKADDTNE